VSLWHVHSPLPASPSSHVPCALHVWHAPPGHCRMHRAPEYPGLHLSHGPPNSLPAQNPNVDRSKHTHLNG